MQYQKIINELTHGELSKLTYEANDVIAKIREREIEHAKWIPCDYKTMSHGFIENLPNGGVCCSNCRRGFKKEVAEFSTYCPECGAKLDEEL